MTDTTLKAKKKAIDSAAWMNQAPHPLPIFRKGSKVSVYRGSGWSAGHVIESSRDGCSVKLSQGEQMVRVYDRRSIKQVES